MEKDIVCGKYLIAIEESKVAEWVRDPVCSERINIKEAKATTLYKNSTYYFCCKICKKVFDANPSAYADKEEGYFDPNNPNDFIQPIFRIL